MLTLHLYSSSSELHDLILSDYYQGKSPSLDDYAASESVILAPGPAVADRCYRFFQNTVPLHITTMAFFLNRCLSSFLPHLRENALRKADLMLLFFAMMKKTKNEPLSQTNFEKYYLLFGEMRVISPDFAYFAQWDLFQKEEYRPIKSFYDVMSKSGGIDEAEMYRQLMKFLLKDSFHSQELKNFPWKNLFIVGVKQLSLVQIDFFKVWGDIFNVHLYLPYDFYHQCHDLDWPKLFGSSSLRLERKEKRRENRREDDREKKLKVIVFNSSQGPLNIEGSTTSYCFRDELEALEAWQIWGDEWTVKEMVPFYHRHLEDIFQDLLPGKALSEYMDYLREKIQEGCSGLTDHGFFPLFRLKTIQSIFHCFSKLEGHLSSHMMSREDCLFLKSIVELNLPRNYLITGNSQKVVYNLSSAELDLLTQRDLKHSFILTHNHYFQSSPQKHLLELYFPDDFQELKKILHFKRRGLESDWNLLAFQRVLQSMEGCLYVEQEVFEEVEIGELIRSIPCEVNISNNTHRIHSKVSVQVSSLTRPSVTWVSPSRLQSYWECPRQFYMHHIIKKSAQTPLFLNKKDMALVLRDSHAHCRALSLKPESEWSLGIIEVLQKIQLESATFKAKDDAFFFYQLKLYLYNLCTFWAKVPPTMKIRFSEEIIVPGPTYSFKGVVDALIEDCQEDKGVQRIVLCDFKLSSWSIPSLKEVEEFKNLLPWSYWSKLNEMKARNIHQYAFINLEDLSESFYFSNTKKEDVLHSGWSMANLDGHYYFIDQWEEKLKISYQSIEDKLCFNITNDHTYSPHYRFQDTCQFCSLKNHCLNRKKIQS